MIYPEKEYRQGQYHPEHAHYETGGQEDDQAEYEEDDGVGYHQRLLPLLVLLRQGPDQFHNPGKGQGSAENLHEHVQEPVSRNGQQYHEQAGHQCGCGPDYYALSAFESEYYHRMFTLNVTRACKDSTLGLIRHLANEFQPDYPELLLGIDVSQFLESLLHVVGLGGTEIVEDFLHVILIHHLGYAVVQIEAGPGIDYRLHFVYQLQQVLIAGAGDVLQRQLAVDGAYDLHLVGGLNIVSSMFRII